MLKQILIAIIVITATLAAADAKSDAFGLGIIVGEPTGLSMKNG